jgi:SAM-dependent methyltransferase
MTSSTPKPHYEAQKFFDHIAEDYRKRSETAVYNVSSLSFRRRQDLVSELLKTTPQNGTVLDYGMGPAVFGPPAASFGLRYVGVDISPKMVELAKGMNIPRAEFHIGDLEALGKFHNAADTVLLIGLIDYLEDPAEGLRRLSKCVRPGGRLILSFRNHRSVPRLLRNSSKAVWGALRGSKRKNETAFEAPVLENSFVPQRDFIPLLGECGFTQFDVRYLDCSPIFFNMPLPKPIWSLGRKLDAAFSCSALSFMCASGVVMAYGKR